MNQPYAQLPPTTRTSTAAIISLIAGILGFVQILPVIGPIAAVIAGHIAKSEIKKSGGMVTGNGMATTGLILGYLMIALGFCLTCIGILAFTGAITLPFAIPFLTPSYNTGY
jgi:TctA family transporter